MKNWIKVVNEENKEILFKYDIVLIRFDIPLMFIVKDDEDNKYLVLCIDEETEDYLIVKKNDENLLDLFERKITMRQAFIDNNEYIGIISYNKDKFKIKEISTKELTDEILPDEGVYYTLENDEISEYIKHLKSSNSYRFNYLYKSFEISNNIIIKKYNKNNHNVLIKEYKDFICVSNKNNMFKGYIEEKNIDKNDKITIKISTKKENCYRIKSKIRYACAS